MDRECVDVRLSKMKEVIKDYAELSYITESRSKHIVKYIKLFKHWLCYLFNGE